MGKPADAPRRRGAERRGRRAEWVAAWLLRAKGWRVLDRRFRTPRGEIDIVARRGRTIAIVEVKARATLTAAIEAVVPATRRRLIDAAGHWLSRNPRHADSAIRFDVIALAPWRWPRHLESAFDASD